MKKEKKKKKKARTGLNRRIALLIFTVCLILIAAFSAFQIKIQLDILTNYNAHRAQMAAILVKNKMETPLARASEKPQLIQSFNRTISSISREKIVESATVYDDKYKIVASSDKEIVGFSATPADTARMREIAKSPLSQWFYTFIDKNTRTLYIFTPLITGDKASYYVKTSFFLGNIQDAIRETSATMIATTGAIAFILIILGIMISRTVVKPLKVLNKATRTIADGNLDLRVDVRTHDEIEDLGDTFNEMTIALKKMKARAENANPLTKLPGNTVIREITEDALNKDKKIVLIYSDLDHFKAFNDYYGIKKGDEAIQLTADLMREALKKKGNPDDFLGHEGGDDFVMITTPDKVDDLTDYFIERFNEEIVKLYNEEDRKRGRIVAPDRQGILKEFSLMSVSLGGVSTEHRKFNNYAEITNVLPEVKHEAKSIEGSSFFMDRRIQ